MSHESSYELVNGFSLKIRISARFRVSIRVRVGISVRVTGIFLSG